MSLGDDFKADFEKYAVKGEAQVKILESDVPPVKPVMKETVPEFPDDISLLGDHELGKYLGLYNAAASWAEQVIAQKEVDLGTADRILDHVYHIKLSRLTGSLADRTRAMKADTTYFDYQNEREKIKAEIDLLKPRRSALKLYATSISREITIRHDDPTKNTGGREDNSSSPNREKPSGKSIYDLPGSGGS